MNSEVSMQYIKQAYNKGENIMKLFRDMESSSTNSLKSILVSYDMQSGNYIKNLENLEHKEFNRKYTQSIANILNKFECSSVIEAGVGEATTLVNVVKKMKVMPESICGFDLSWSRIAFAKGYSKIDIPNANLFVGNLFEIPILDNSFDVVYTSHTIEPNHGKEREALSELYRITGKYLILLEPSYELGNQETKKHIEEHKYCKNLLKFSEELGYKIIEHRLFDCSGSDYNQTGLIIIEKKNQNCLQRETFYACPNCKLELILHKENYFCENCYLIFPVISGIPCLLISNGVLGSKYLEV